MNKIKINKIKIKDKRADGEESCCKVILSL